MVHVVIPAATAEGLPRISYAELEAITAGFAQRVAATFCSETYDGRIYIHHMLTNSNAIAIDRLAGLTDPELEPHNGGSSAGAGAGADADEAKSKEARVLVKRLLAETDDEFRWMVAIYDRLAALRASDPRAAREFQGLALPVAVCPRSSSSEGGPGADGTEAGTDAGATCAPHRCLVFRRRPETLAGLLARAEKGPTALDVPWHDLAAALHDAAQAVASLRALPFPVPVVSLNVKPSNFLVEPDGRLVLALSIRLPASRSARLTPSSNAADWAGSFAVTRLLSREGRLRPGSGPFLEPGFEPNREPSPLDDVYALGIVIRAVLRASAAIAGGGSGWPPEAVQQLHSEAAQCASSDRRGRPYPEDVAARLHALLALTGAPTGAHSDLCGACGVRPRGGLLK
eukprot:tig00000113_g5636.t1